MVTINQNKELVYFVTIILIFLYTINLIFLYKVGLFEEPLHPLLFLASACSPCLSDIHFKLSQAIVVWNLKQISQCVQAQANKMANRYEYHV